MWGSESKFSVQVVGLSADHPGFKEAQSGGVGTSGNHTSFSPINEMTGRVCMHVLLGLRWPVHHCLLPFGVP